MSLHRISAVRRDRRFLWIPERHLRNVLFVGFSILTVLVPIAYYFLFHPTTNPDTILLAKSRAGKPAEIFRSISDLLHYPSVGYHDFNEALLRVSYESHRFGREVKGLAFLVGDASKNLNATDFAAELDRLSDRLDARIYIPCQIATLRFHLCSTISDEDAALRSSECQGIGFPGFSSSLSECPENTTEGPALPQDVLRAIGDLLKSQGEEFDTIPSHSHENAGIGASSVSTGSADTSTDGSLTATTETGRISAQTLQKHLVTKRGEIFRLLSNPPLTQRPRDSRASGVAPLAQDLLERTQDVQLLATRIRDASCYVSIILAVLAALFWYRMWEGRKYALGRGRWRAQLVVYIFLVLQIYNVVLLGAYEPESRILDEESVVKKTDFLKDAYKTATQEIHHRLEQEQHFYILKFTMIGSLLAVFFRFLLSPEGSGNSEEAEPGSLAEKADENGSKHIRTHGEQRRKGPARWSHVRRKVGAKDAIDRLRESKIAAFFFWAAVIINCIVDTRLRYNAVICTALGRWIRTLEGSIEEHGLAGWETFFEQQALISSSPLMQVAPTLLTTVVFILTVVLFLAKERAVISVRGNAHDNLRQVNLVFGSVSFLVMAFSGLGRPSMPWEWLAPVISWVIAGVALLYLGPKAINGRVFRRDEITDALIGYAFPFHYFDLHKRLPLPSLGRSAPGNPESTYQAWVKRLVRFICLSCYGSGLRVVSYLPVPGLRRRLVNAVFSSLGIELIHLEINSDPPLGQFLSELHDAPASDSTPWCWSVLYLRSGDAGISRLMGGKSKRPLAASLREDSESAQLAKAWMKRRLRYITESNGSFRIHAPSDLLVSGGGDDHEVRCDRVYFCRVHDFYDEHNPWILFICVINTKDEKEKGDRRPRKYDVVVLSAKDGDTHRLGIASNWLGEFAPVPVSDHPRTSIS